MSISRRRLFRVVATGKTNHRGVAWGASHLGLIFGETPLDVDPYHNHILGLKITKQQAAPGRRSCYAARFSALLGLEEPRTNSRRLAQRCFWASHRGGYVGGRRHLACVWPMSSVLMCWCCPELEQSQR
ncbi:hypothetical protein GGP41_008877 [Bipolaris sorokiniana]|uniref:Uncharacterized protein n=1 Tax=Cochliobolus sativus TaxID=45130 RepID=A0A8H5Z8U6_COCSA|nr:hypothetical protein GGP41_008877 [Bipolaris sorokiniana]